MSRLHTFEKIFFTPQASSGQLHWKKYKKMLSSTFQSSKSNSATSLNQSFFGFQPTVSEVSQFVGVRCIADHTKFHLRRIISTYVVQLNIVHSKVHSVTNTYAHWGNNPIISMTQSSVCSDRPNRKYRNFGVLALLVWFGRIPHC